MRWDRLIGFIFIVAVVIFVFKMDALKRERKAEKNLGDQSTAITQSVGLSNWMKFLKPETPSAEVNNDNYKRICLESSFYDSCVGKTIEMRMLFDASNNNRNFAANLFSPHRITFVFDQPFWDPNEKLAGVGDYLLYGTITSVSEWGANVEHSLIKKVYRTMAQVKADDISEKDSFNKDIADSYKSFRASCLASYKSMQMTGMLIKYFEQIGDGFKRMKDFKRNERGQRYAAICPLGYTVGYGNLTPALVCEETPNGFRTTSTEVRPAECTVSP